MSVHIKLSTTLRPFVPGYDPEKGLEYDVDSASSINLAQMAEKLAIPLEEIKFVMVNGRYQPLDAIIHENDRIAYFPAVGGG